MRFIALLFPFQPNDPFRPLNPDQLAHGKS